MTATELKYIESENFLATHPKWEAGGWGSAKEYLELVEYVP